MRKPFVQILECMIFTHWSFCDFLLRLGWGIWIWCRNSKVQYIQGNLWRRTLFKLSFLHAFQKSFRILDADSKDATHFHIKWQSPSYLHLDCSAKLTHYAGSSSLDFGLNLCVTLYNCTSSTISPEQNWTISEQSEDELQIGINIFIEWLSVILILKKWSWVTGVILR